MQQSVGMPGPIWPGMERPGKEWRHKLWWDPLPPSPPQKKKYDVKKLLVLTWRPHNSIEIQDCSFGRTPQKENSWNFSKVRHKKNQDLRLNHFFAKKDLNF